MKHLFDIFPRVKLADLPTPVCELRELNKSYPAVRLSMKQDNLSGPIYGGNKIRKLEFLLGEALKEGRKRVITYGAAGSNHALATAICCRKPGFQPISILAPQKPTRHVLKNLLMGYASGAELHLCNDFCEFPERTEQICAKYTSEDGIAPYIIPAGGTNEVGALGFVNAALELAEQMEPDRIYLPMGTGGTLAGLLVGLKLAGLKSRIIAVRVVEPAFRNAGHVLELCNALCRKLGTEPLVTPADIEIDDRFLGPGYGIATPEGEAAVARLKQVEGLQLEGTYTGKTVAAMLHDLENEDLSGQTILYWNTLNSRDFSAQIEGIDFHALPHAFHPMFS